MALSTPAFAQTQTQAQAQTQVTTQATAPAAADSTVVVVTGIRGSLRSARALKKNADQIVDSVQATDIGKLPDVNTVESLQRVSGVQIQRRYGEGGTDYDHRTTPAVTIRGLVYVRNLVDGHDVYSANGGREPDLEGYAPELMAGIDVYKNPSSSLIEGGVGGVIDLRTRLPFDSRTDVASFTIKDTDYDRARKNGLTYSGLYSKAWDTGHGRMGFLIDGSFGKSYYRQDAILQQLPVAVPLGSVNGAGTPVVFPGATGTVYVPSSFEAYQDSGNRVRKGGSAAFQWQPDATKLLTVQYLHNEYQFIRRGEYFYGDNNSKGLIPTPTPGAAFTYDKNGVATSGSLVAGFETARYDQDVRNNVNNFVANLKWDITPKLHSKSDLQLLGTTYDTDRNGLSLTNFQNGTQYVYNAPNPVTLTFDTRGDKPEVSILQSAAYTNKNLWYVSYMADAMDRNSLKLQAVSQTFDYDHDGDLFHKLHAGVRLSDTKVLLRGTWNASCITATGPDTSCASTDQFAPVSQHPELAYVGPMPGFFNGREFGSILFPEFENPGSSVLARTIATEKLFGMAYKTYFSPSDINRQTESTAALFLSADFGSTLFNLPFDGNLGVRAVNTDHTSEGYVFDSAGVSTPSSLEKKYASVLPSANIRFHLNDSLQLRLAYGKAITRPDFAQMSTNTTLGSTLSVDTAGRPTGSSGNPYLNPIKADSYDASLEYYFGTSNSASLGVFQKNVDGFLASGVQQRNVNGVTYDISTNVNTGKGTVKGFEAAYQQFFDFLPGPFKGLGFQANYTYVDSSVQNPFYVAGSATPQSTPLEKLSKNNYNLIAIYELGPVSARIAYNWRSSYLDQTSGSGANGVPQYQKPYSDLDGSIAYDLNKNFTVVVDVVNVTNSMSTSYTGQVDRPLQWTLSDRRIGVALRGKF